MRGPERMVRTGGGRRSVVAEIWQSLRVLTDCLEGSVVGVRYSGYSWDTDGCLR